MKEVYIVEVVDLAHKGNCIGVFDKIASAQSAIFEYEADHREKINPKFYSLSTGEYVIRFPKDKDAELRDYYIKKFLVIP